MLLLNAELEFAKATRVAISISLERFSNNILSGVPPLTETRDRMARLNVTRLREIPPISDYVQDLPQAVMIILNKALEFDPEKRYQNPGAMLKDIEKAIQVMEAGGEATAAVLEAPAVDEADMSQEGEGKTIMVVENKHEFQDLLREKLKNRGYRVLVLGDPQRAMARFTEAEDTVADCVIVSAINLGNDALDFFNQIGEQAQTKDLPVLLLAISVRFTSLNAQEYPIIAKSLRCLLKFENCERQSCNSCKQSQ